MFYNNLLSIPILIAASFTFEDWGGENVAKNLYPTKSLLIANPSPAESRNSLIFAILVSGFSSVFISYCTAWCIRVTSSTTYSY